MTDWHPDPDQLVELALLDVSAEDEERLAAHLVACADCRADYAGIEDSVQRALAATPAIAPPAGFSGRVLTAMGISEDSGAEPTRPNRGRGRFRLLVAAAALVGLLAGVGGTLAVTSWLGLQAPGTPHVPVSADLVTGSGETVGSAGITTLGGRDYVAVSVTQGRPGMSYECFLVGADGSRTSGGTWTLTGDYGAEATGTWLVPLSGPPPAAVELVGQTGRTWSTARF